MTSAINHRSPLAFWQKRERLSTWPTTPTDLQATTEHCGHGRSPPTSTEPEVKVRVRRRMFLTRRLGNQSQQLVGVRLWTFLADIIMNAWANARVRSTVCEHCGVGVRCQTFGPEHRSRCRGWLPAASSRSVKNANKSTWISETANHSSPLAFVYESFWLTA